MDHFHSIGNIHAIVCLFECYIDLHDYLLAFRAGCFVVLRDLLVFLHCLAELDVELLALQTLEKQQQIDRCKNDGSIGP